MEIKAFTPVSFRYDNSEFWDADWIEIPER